MYQFSPFYYVFCCLSHLLSYGAMPHVLLMVVNYSSRCLNNKSQITCVCKMVINNASVPWNHRWILTYHLRQFPENVTLLLPMGSRSVQVFYNLCQKKIKRVCQCPESKVKDWGTPHGNRIGICISICTYHYWNTIDSASPQGHFLRLECPLSPTSSRSCLFLWVTVAFKSEEVALWVEAESMVFQ